MCCETSCFQTIWETKQLEKNLYALILHSTAFWVYSSHCEREMQTYKQQQQTHNQIDQVLLLFYCYGLQFYLISAIIWILYKSYNTIQFQSNITRMHTEWSRHKMPKFYCCSSINLCAWNMYRASYLHLCWLYVCIYMLPPYQLDWLLFLPFLSKYTT